MKNSLHEFSVLMTVYKNEKAEYLNSALNSIEDQTLTPNEIVLVKDGELSDSLDSVIDKHVKKFNSKYKVISLSKNHGRGYASRIGIKYISNLWFARMDSDDISLENRFELQMLAIQKNSKRYPKLAAVGGQVNEFLDDKNNIIGSRRVPLTPKEIAHYAAYRSPINNPTVMINKSALMKVGNYPTLNVLEDYDLWISFLTNDFTLINIPNTLVNMRVGNGMYERRGGLDYLSSYIKQKKAWKREGIGNSKTVLVSIFAMIGSTIVPVAVRKYLYQKFLHK